jgi:hypothetical protein
MSFDSTCRRLAEQLRAGIPIDLIIEASGLSIAEITQLKQANHL